jgi:hypothetical protein
MSRAEWARSAEIAARVDYLELAANPDFNDVFMDNLAF